jgi:hypothetical protein
MRHVLPSFDIFTYVSGGFHKFRWNSLIGFDSALVLYFHWSMMEMRWQGNMTRVT